MFVIFSFTHTAFLGVLHSGCEVKNKVQVVHNVETVSCCGDIQMLIEHYDRDLRLNTCEKMIAV